MLWCARMWMDATTGGLTTGLAIILDAALIGSHLWANAPLHARDPERFGRNDSATKIFLAPIMLAGLLLLRDVWLAVSQ